MSPKPLSIVYLLEDTPLFGGVKVALQQANLLAARGHRVTVVSPGERPAWFPLEAEFLRTPGLDPRHIPHADVLVATYWTTLSRARAARSGQVLHYCQGFEASYTHNADEHEAIRQAYAVEAPAMVVSPHLGRLLRERFGRPSRVVPQPLEPYWRPRRRWRPHRPPRILVTSPFEIDWKGVETALRAVLTLCGEGFDCRLVRLSQWPLSDAERALLEPDEFHEHLEPRAVADLVRSCDLLLAPSWEPEGFGLPVLEAMACGVPVVASDISCFRDFAASAATLVPPRNPEAFAAAAREVLGARQLWQARRREGKAVAARFGDEPSASVAEQTMIWAASGAWRQEL